uniref:ninja-family protein AFP3 n=1 Tax=Erigeron canadensis TaxID=72917 RepID=UPI001CB8F57D|nr:ninja-family protein AFP3 [Erigeron canadensis]
MSEEKTSNEMENLSLQAKNRCPRDLLQRFTIPISGIGAPRSSYPDEDPGSGDEIELNLGLSLGGRFGVDKGGNSKLIRSSSIATILPVVRNEDVLDSLKNPGSGPGRAYSGLVRTSSLPVETEEEWRKRKDLQSLRRLAAKRRRSEKQRNVTKGERDDYVAAMGRVGSSPGPCFGSDKWSEFDARSRQRQGSSGSVGQTSTLLQERKNKISSGLSRKNESPIGMERESQDKTRMKEIGSDSVEEMPCVFTQGDGPDGRVIEGILYKYGKGEKVKIMCVCHGSFLSPAEFVKHAGGTDIAHPLKHIVVKASPSLS